MVSKLRIIWKRTRMPYFLFIDQATTCLYRATNGHDLDPSGLDRLEANRMARPGPAYSRPSHAAEILLSQDGKFVYVSNRGHDSIASFQLDSSSGLLTPVSGGSLKSDHYVASGGRIPWGAQRFIYLRGCPGLLILPLPFFSCSSHLCL